MRRGRADELSPVPGGGPRGAQMGSPMAEVEYYRQHRDHRWVMEDYYYTKIFDVDAETTLQIVFIDTVVFAEATFIKGMLRDVTDGRVPQAAYVTYMSRRADVTARLRTQLDWLNRTLSESRATWLLVAGHYPVYSGGEHGSTEELLLLLLPLLTRHGVHAYLCGHDHTLQHLHSGSIDYYVSGNGGKRGTYSPIPESRFGIVEPGFTAHEVTRNTMAVRYFGHDGRLLYSTVQARRPRT